VWYVETRQTVPSEHPILTNASWSAPKISTRRAAVSVSDLPKNSFAWTFSKAFYFSMFNLFFATPTKTSSASQHLRRHAKIAEVDLLTGAVLNSCRSFNIRF
jgi:hypothetical protein